jgi:hypothetical protein
MTRREWKEGLNVGVDKVVVGVDNTHRMIIHLVVHLAGVAHRVALVAVDQTHLPVARVVVLVVAVDQTHLPVVRVGDQHRLLVGQDQEDWTLGVQVSGGIGNALANDTYVLSEESRKGFNR